MTTRQPSPPTTPGRTAGPLLPPSLQKLLLEASPMGMVCICKRKVQWSNPAHDTLLGYAVGECAGMESRAFYARLEDYDRVGGEGYAQIAKSGGYSTEVKLKRKDGTEFWTCLAGQAVQANDLAAGTIWFLQDVTESKRTLENLEDTQAKHVEEELRKRERRFTQLIENSFDTIVILDAEGIQRYVSPTAMKCHGYHPRELVNIPVIREMIHPEDQERVTAAFLNIIKNGQGGTEYRHRRKGGGWVYLEGWGTNQLHNPDIQGIVVNVRDVTERKLAEQALRESEERYRVLFEQAAEGIALMDIGTRKLVHANSAMSRLFGYTRAELQAMEMQQLHPAEAMPQIAQDLEAQLSGAKILAADIPCRRKDGSLFYADVNGQPMVVDGRPHMVGFFTDITARKQAEAEQTRIETQQRHLQKAASLGRMAGAIAHHFNNQLQVLMMDLDFAMHSQGKVAKETLAEAMQAARKAAEVSNMMLTYLGQTQNNRKPLNLSTTCLRNLSLLRTAMPPHLALETALATPGPMICADASQIQQLLNNLVTNAWEASADGQGAIRLSVYLAAPSQIAASHRYPIGWQGQAPSYACLEIADRGCGIAPGDVENVFDPFFSRKFAGRGMGLSVVLGIVQAHQGVITVESNQGQGSIFRVYFPVSSEPASAPATSRAPRIKAAEKLTVLLIEDDEAVRCSTTFALKRLGYSVLAACDGKDAIELFNLHKEKIELVLSDLTMPRMDGWETLTALRKLAPKLPVILSSGFSEAEAMAGQHPELPDAFLGKPYDLDELGNVIAATMDKAKKRP